MGHPHAHVQDLAVDLLEGEVVGQWGSILELEEQRGLVGPAVLNAGAGEEKEVHLEPGVEEPSRRIHLDPVEVAGERPAARGLLEHHARRGIPAAAP